MSFVKSIVKPALVTISAVFLAAAGSPSSAAIVRIGNDPGGQIGVYWSRYMALRDSKDRVMIDGKCASACTLVLGLVPARRICVTKNARFGFHAAWQPGFLGFHVINAPATRLLMSIYPVPIRRWIASNGGLGRRMIYLYGRDVIGLYRECPRNDDRQPRPRVAGRKATAR
jgi:hypothetical protein